MLHQVNSGGILTLGATLTHQFFKRLMQENKLQRIYSQNIDMLESHMKSGPRGSIRLEDKTVFLHGTIMHQKCSINPAHRSLISEAVREAWKREELMHCTECFPYNSFGRPISVGIMGPDIDLYNSGNSSRADSIGELMEMDLQCADCLLVVGTSLRKEVVGARKLVTGFSKEILRKGGLTFWINPAESPKGFRFSHGINLMADDVFGSIFTEWKPELKRLKVQIPPVFIPTRELRKKPMVKYDGLDRNRLSRTELRSRERIRKKVM